MVFTGESWHMMPSNWLAEDPSSLRAAIATLGVAAQWQRALELYGHGQQLDVYAGPGVVNRAGLLQGWEIWRLFFLG